MVGNPCSAGTVLQALPAVQGGRSVNSADLDHGLTVGAENLDFAGLRSVNGGIDGHVMGDVSGRAQSSGNHVSHAITLALVSGGTLMDSIKEHCKAPSFEWLSTISESVMFRGKCSERN